MIGTGGNDAILEVDEVEVVKVRQPALKFIGNGKSDYERMEKPQKNRPRN